MARYADFDAALARRGPLQFRLFGEQWLIPGLPFQRVAAMLDIMGGDGATEASQAQAVNDFLADIVNDRKKWLKFSANADVSTLLGVAKWIAENEAGMPLVPDEDADPLVPSPALSLSSPQNGLSLAGSSPPSASTTP